MKKITTFILAFLVAHSAWAYHFMVDDIYYNITSGSTVGVTYESYGIATPKYTGSITIPSTVDYLSVTYNVTSIEWKAFGGCNSLTSITISSSVTSIGNSAFENCTGLTSVTIPSSVTSIEWAAFSRCSGLTSINVDTDNVNYSSQDGVLFNKNKTTIICCPGGKTGEYIISSSVTSIGDDAFYSCSLSSINVDTDNVNYSSQDGVLFNKNKTTLIRCPGGKTGEYIISSSVTSIWDGAFENCSGLTSITIPSSVTWIGYAAFVGTAWYNSQPDGMLYLDNWVIDYKGTMPANTSITINNGTVGIAGAAFSGCTGLTAITIPSSVTLIGNGAFADCGGLTSITIPSSVTSIGNSAFINCGGLTSITIPSSVTSIRGWAFSHCTGLTSVTIPSSITWIEDDAFYGCTGLTSVNFNATNCTTMGSSWNPVFEGCTSLRSLTIGSNVTTISSYAFRGCSGLTSVTIPSSVTLIGDGAFQDCSGLTSITIPSSVTSIEYATFSGCSGLTSITIPSSVTWIGWAAFANCSGLTSITIPSSVFSIEGEAFQGTAWYNSQPDGMLYLNNWVIDYKGTMPAKTSITIKNGTVGIAGCAFRDCSGLTSISIPSSVTLIGDGAFEGCNSLTSITIPSSVTWIGWTAFGNCSGLTSITIPSSVTSIWGWAFSGCTGLTSITIPSSITRIEDDTFAYCSGLTSITIPSSVTSIGDGAFYRCSGLTSIYAYPVTPVDLSLSSDVFYDVNKTSCTLYVPKGSGSAYESAVQWTDFNNIAETLLTAVKDVNLTKLNIYTQGTSMIVEHAEGYLVSVYNIAGQKVSEVTNPASTQTISVPQAGVYVVRVGGETQKVITTHP